jgi:hypothetical protein
MHFVRFSRVLVRDSEAHSFFQYSVHKSIAFSEASSPDSAALCFLFKIPDDQ